MTYRSPLADMMFMLDHVVDYASVARTDRFAEAGEGVAHAILSEAARMCDGVLAPLQRAGDLHPAFLENGVVRTSPGFAAGYRAIAEGGWIGMAAPQSAGGMGLPQTLTTVVNEMMAGACLALQLNPLMTQGQIEALEHHASDAIKALYLPNLTSGRWCGTMNLTEPQAGSDVGALKTKAEDAGDGTYRITGQKIFISWAGNDFTENVCHLVLARLPDAPPGTKGISLFMVPKNLPDANGAPGAANALRVVSLEHKLGLHGSPTAVMSFEGATGWMVGRPNMGMAAMFTMMNNARLGVGVQGIGAGEAAYQQALAYAGQRKQFGKPISDYPDVRRLLTTMKAELFVARAIALDCAVATDLGLATGQDDWRARAAFLTPIAKAFGTDTGIRVADMAIQVHGGMGYIEETGIAQYLRDARVTAIYEGTNGIQAMDLVGRKMADKGAAAMALLGDIAEGARRARGMLPDLADAVHSAVGNLRDDTEKLVACSDMADRGAGAAPYLAAFARVLGGHYHLRAAMAAGGSGPRTDLAAVYIERLLPAHQSLLANARAGADDLFALSLDDLAG
ncbi:MAG: acyl-CoA dehydrogenase [Rhodobacteraceae bacterium]|nr:acyl-CoA dehydrogenase [Paracoccaceae bacterium]